MTAPPLNINSLVAAVDAAVTASGIPFGDSNKPTDAVANKPYVVGYFNGGRVTDRTLLSRDGVEVWAIFHTFGLSPDAVRVGRRQTLQAVFGLSGSTHGGWTVHLPVHSSALTIERDDRVNPALYWQTDEFTIRMTPA